MRKFLTVAMMLPGALSAAARGGGHAAAEVHADTLKAAVVSSADGSTIVSQRISQEEIRTVTALPEAIRRFAGVQVRDYGGVGGLKTVNVRSLGSEHTGVFIDGIQVDNAQNMQVDLGRFGTDDLRGISLFSGHRTSMLQGAKEYSSSSSIYLETAGPEFKDGSKDNFRMGAKAGSFATLSCSSTWEHLSKDGKSLRLTGEATDSRGEYRFHARDFRRYPDGSIQGYDTAMVRRNCDLRSVRLEGRLYSSPSSDASWNLHAYFYGSGRGLPGPVYKRVDGYPLSEDRQKDRDAFLQGRYSRSLGGRWSVMAKAKCSFSHLTYIDVPELRPELPAARFNYRNHSAYASCAASTGIGEACRLDLAQDVQYDYLDTDLSGFSFPARLSTWTAVSGTVAKGGLEASATILGLHVHDTFLSDGARKSAGRDAVMPSAIARWKLSGRFCLNGFAKRSYRMPTFNDLYYTTVGSKDLAPEDASQFGLGAVWTPSLPARGGFSLKADIYHNRLKDKIVAVPTSNQFRWSMYNLGKVGILGADITADYRRDAGESVFGTTVRYTFQRSRDRTDRGALTWNGQIPYIPVHSGSANIFNEYRGWRLDVTLFAMGERFTTSANLPAYRLRPWTTLDAAVSRPFILGGNLLSIGLRLANLLGRQYEVVDNYPMPGFNAMLKVSYSFSRPGPMSGTQSAK